MLYLFTLVYGFGLGGFSSATALVGDIFGLSNIGVILGVLEVGWWIGLAVGPIIGGVIFDINNSYTTGFLISAAAIAIIGLLLALVQQNQKETIERE